MRKCLRKYVRKYLKKCLKKYLRSYLKNYPKIYRRTRSNGNHEAQALPAPAKSYAALAPKDFALPDV
jgi:hypothetical protein